MYRSSERVLYRKTADSLMWRSAAGAHGGTRGRSSRTALSNVNHGSGVKAGKQEAAPARTSEGCSVVLRSVDNVARSLGCCDGSAGIGRL